MYAYVPVNRPPIRSCVDIFSFFERLSTVYSFICVGSETPDLNNFTSTKGGASGSRLIPIRHGKPTNVRLNIYSVGETLPDTAPFRWNTDIYPWRNDFVVVATSRAREAPKDVSNSLRSSNQWIVVWLMYPSRIFGIFSLSIKFRRVLVINMFCVKRFEICCEIERFVALFSTNFFKIFKK